MITPLKKHCQWIEPSIVAKHLINSFGESGFIWLDGDGSENGRWVTLGVEPDEQICSRGLPGKENASNPFTLLRNLKPGHWTGWLSYEAGAWLEPKNSWKEDEMATLWMASHDPIFKFDLHKKILWLEGCNQKRFNSFLKWLNNLSSNKFANNDRNINKQRINIPIDKWQWITQLDEYQKNVEAIKKLIEQGDIFQANLSACCKAKAPSPILATDLYLQLKAKCPSPFSGILVGAGESLGEAIISTSPERFLKVLPCGAVESRPIKGTRPRDKNPLIDANLAADLICSPKDRAENIMIVDLLRNDLGKVCQAGSINVNQLVGLESYSQVHHLTSVIQGKLKPNKTWVDLLEASWPGGSITGAPKLRACQRLYELEPIARGPYCGSFININWDGQVDSNILIRSLIIKDSCIRVHAGCGIVADSNANNESEELKWKLMPLLKSIV